MCAIPEEVRFRIQTKARNGAVESGKPNILNLTLNLHTSLRQVSRDKQAFEKQVMDLKEELNVARSNSKEAEVSTPAPYTLHPTP